MPYLKTKEKNKELRMNFNISNIDLTKADPCLEHEYVIETEENMGLPKDERISVICSYIKVGEQTRYIDKAGSFDAVKIVADKVKKIKNLSVNGVPITDAKVFTNLPSANPLMEIFSMIFAHIVAGARLTEDEEKNLE